MRRKLCAIALSTLLVVLAACDTQSGVAERAPAPASANARATMPAPSPIAPTSAAAITSTAAPASAAPATTEASAAPTVTQPASPAAVAPTLDLPAGWTKIEPGGEAVCARGTPYAFWVRPGTVNRLLVFFQGGGGCWDAASCRPGSGFFEDSVTDADSPADADGIFALDNPENPFREYSMVYVPYCTGDVHMGNNVETYTDDQGSVTINHTGFRNGSTALEWIYQHFPAPERIFVTGCSAGSIGSIMFAPYLLQHYPDAQVAQLGDSEAFVFHRPIDIQDGYGAHDNFPDWIPAMQAIRPGEFTMARFYTAVATYYPDTIFSQYNTAHDSVQQRFFYAQDGATGAWEDALEASLSEIQASAPNFRSCLMGGATHCMTGLPRFYSYQVNGVRIRDWVDDLANGRPVANLRCTLCDAPEEVTP